MLTPGLLCLDGGLDGCAILLAQVLDAVGDTLAAYWLFVRAKTVE